jgi:subtilisin-like proprotein convertase family protein
MRAVFSMNPGMTVEHAEVEVDLQVEQLEELTLKLIAPSGTESILLNLHGKKSDGTLSASAIETQKWLGGRFRHRLMTTHDWGEASGGKWTLEVSNRGVPVKLNACSLRLSGSKATADDTYFYTDEYATAVASQPQRAILDDAINGTAGGEDTLNAAAVSGNTTINLATGAATIGGAPLTLRNPQNIHLLFTGDGDDVLVAGQTSTLLDAGRGHNTLIGGSKRDCFVIRRRDGGSDTIENFDAADSESLLLVGFGKKRFEHLAPTQQDNDTHIDLGAGQKIIFKDRSINQFNATHFKFQDTFTLPKENATPGISDNSPAPTSKTILLEGGTVRYAGLTGDQSGGQDISSIGDTDSPDHALPTIFVVKNQPEKTDYHNTIKGFRQSRDKIDLSQTGITSFDQLQITKSLRLTINDQPVIHGVDIRTKAIGSSGQEVQLIYLDALEVAQIKPESFIFVPDPTKPSVPTADPSPVRDENQNAATYRMLEAGAQWHIDVRQAFGNTHSTDGVQRQYTHAMQDDTPLPTWLTFDSATKTLSGTPPSGTTGTFKLALSAAGVAAGQNTEKTLLELDIRSKIVVARSGQPAGVLDPAAAIRIEGGAQTTVNAPAGSVISIEGEVPQAVLPGNASKKVIVSTPYTHVTTEDANDTIHLKADSSATTLQARHGHNTITAAGDYQAISLGDGNNTVRLNGRSSVVDAGDGNNKIVSADNRAKIVLGNGDNVVEGAAASVTAGNGANTIKGSFATIEVGAGVNTIEDTASTAHLTLGDGTHTATVTGASSTVEVTHGSYDVAFRGDQGRLVFTDTPSSKLWFEHKNQDLQISVPGTSEEVTVLGWYASSPHRPLSIKAGNGQELTATNVEKLVQAMASFGAPNGPGVGIVVEQHPSLEAVLTANWR